MKERNEEVVDDINYQQESHRERLGAEYIYSIKFNPVEVTEKDAIARMRRSIFPKIEDLPKRERVVIWQEVDKVLNFSRSYRVGNKEIVEEPHNIILACKLIAAGYTKQFIADYFGRWPDKIYGMQNIAEKAFRFLFDKKIITTSSEAINKRVPYLANFDNSSKEKRVFNIYSVFTRIPEIIDRNLELKTLVEENPHLQYLLADLATGRSIDEIANEYGSRVNIHYKSKIVKYLLYGKPEPTGHALFKDMVLGKFLSKQEFFIRSLNSDEIGYVINSKLISLLEGFLIRKTDLDIKDYTKLINFIEILPYIHTLVVEQIEQIEDEKIKQRLINKYFVNTEYSTQLPVAEGNGNKHKNFAINYLKGLGNSISPALLYLADAALSSEQSGEEIATYLKNVLSRHMPELNFQVGTLKKSLAIGQRLIINTLLMNPDNHEVSIKDQLLYQRHKAITKTMILLREEILRSNIDLYEIGAQEENNAQN